jgi:D-alanyl-D-alanine carboxypeptidase/D-alanyl-D-alanine-endopeptidase (penicillin-binding protein 4)
VATTLVKAGSVRTAAWLAAAVLSAAAIGAWTSRGTHADEGRDASREVALDGDRGRAGELGTAEPQVALPVADSPHASERRETAAEPLRSADERPRAIDPLLERRVEALVGKAVTDAARFSKNAANSQTCVVALRVVDLADGAVVLERLPRTPVAPASNQKLVTSLSALVELGLDWSFETHVDAVGTIANGRLSGDLVVRAGGDPIFVEGDPDHADRRVAELVAGVARHVRSVTGDVVLDLTRFDDAAPAPGWPTTDPWTSSYALASGLCINGGLVSFEVVPSRAGARAAARLVPASTGLIEKLDVATVAGRTNDVRVGLYESSGRLDLVGSIGASVEPYRGDFRHPDPVAYFGHVFARHLAAAGVVVDGEVRRARDVAAGTRLATLTTPWTEYLVPINTHSNNAAADAALMALGLASSGRGTREAGAARVREILASLGTDIHDFVQIDGSGLSRDNRVTVEILSELLARVSKSGDELREPFIASLAIGGRTGTLANRMTGHAAGRVHGKTGFIRGASALSGYVRTEEERELVFSIVVNYPRLDALNNSCWKPMHDAIVEELVLWKRP